MSIICLARYVAPTEAMKEDARRTNEAALNSKPQAKPLRAMLGENAAAKLGAPPQVRVGTVFDTLVSCLNYYLSAMVVY